MGNRGIPGDSGDPGLTAALAIGAAYSSRIAGGSDSMDPWSRDIVCHYFLTLVNGIAEAVVDVVVLWSLVFLWSFRCASSVSNLMFFMTPTGPRIAKVNIF